MSNLSISSTNDLLAWEKFLKNSVNKNIYSHPIYLQNTGENYEKFFITKNNEIFASFFFKRAFNSIKLTEEIIYTPVVFKNFENKPFSSLNNIKFDLITEIKNFFIENFSNVNFISDYHFNDLRPFYWHNFDRKKEIFKVKELKYTSIINLKKLDNVTNLNDSLFYKDLSVRVRQQFNYAQKKKYQIYDKFSKKVFKKIISKTFERQNKKINFDLSLHSYIMEKLNKEGLIFMITVQDKNVDKAFLLFSKILDQAMYLYGGRFSDDKDDYSLSYGMIYSLLELSKLGVNKVDLEGINSPKRGFNKIGYGGEIVPYYQIQMTK